MTPSIMAAWVMKSLFPSPSSSSSWSSATENRLPVRVARRGARRLMGVDGTPSTPDWTGVLGTASRAEMPSAWLWLAVSVRSGPCIWAWSLSAACCWRPATVESLSGPWTKS
ncbi:hypothetical protein GSI_04438 [Ganoderma sinense ZZ0214-1]|uniref:Uncharacterized protein n=1 Tax=Ganoderma sinense ZZ0214-1 TaxID=1077348 RepID=A0A2G8SJ63_9APHY|nr:hypothetical protein GSI_04438 [Ganoderma sinense ZZ0214-1]